MKKPGPVPASAPVPAAEAAYRLPWTLTFAILTILLVTLSWFPLVRMSAPYEFAPNEGFSSNFQHVAATGGRVYGEPPVFYYANYPPLSFHLIGMLGRVTGDTNLAGRWVSVFAWLAIGLFAALTVERITGSRNYGILSGFCWLIWLAAFDHNRIGQNDPHLLGIAISMAAVYCFVRDPESVKWLRISGLLFALSLFTKQSLLAFPAGVAIQLFLTSKKRLWTWLAPLAAASVAMVLLAFVVDGRYFLNHLMLSRTFSFTDLGNVTVQYLSFIQIAFVAALVWAFRNRGMLVWSFAIAHLLGIAAVGGNGAGVNHFYDAMVVVAMIVGVVLAGLETRQLPRPAMIFLILVPAFFSSILVLPQRIPFDLARTERGTPALVREFAAAVNLVRSQPGPALCENLLLCFEAGKPETVDAFALDQSIKTGRLDEQKILQLVASRYFGSIEIESVPTEVIRPVARHRFSAAFVAQLFANYKLALRDSRHAIFVPN